MVMKIACMIVRVNLTEINEEFSLGKKVL
uniref:Uncharacterized protein n=1 Tax=Rhizophora mucronata TaxID=61149 RepID=A0A2P2P6C9_RHIMU